MFMPEKMVYDEQITFSGYHQSLWNFTKSCECLHLMTFKSINTTPNFGRVLLSLLQILLFADSKGKKM